MYGIEINMTAEGHLIFSLSCSIFGKKMALTSELAHGDFWHIILGSLVACLIPDIDHPNSLLGYRLKFLSIPIKKIFGHRGFTHSLLIIYFFIKLNKYLYTSLNILIPKDIFLGMIIGYTSHILADILTPAGVLLLWPLKFRIKLPISFLSKGINYERIFCILVFLSSLIYKNIFIY